MQYVSEKWKIVTSTVFVLCSMWYWWLSHTTESRPPWVGTSACVDYCLIFPSTWRVGCLISKLSGHCESVKDWWEISWVPKTIKRCSLRFCNIQWCLMNKKMLVIWGKYWFIVVLNFVLKYFLWAGYGKKGSTFCTFQYLHFHCISALCFPRSLSTIT